MISRVIETKPEDIPAYPAYPMLIRYDPQALTRLSQGSSVVVATLLALPDSIALIPSSADPLSWALRVLKVWIVALILWFVGSLAMLHLVRLLSAGVRVDARGIRLWRLGHVIPWSRVQAVGLETQALFSRAFRLGQPARRMTIYLSRRPGALSFPQHVPSFLFKLDEFEALYQQLCRARFGFAPEPVDVLVCPAAELPHVKGVYRLVSINRMLLSVLIAVGLVFFLGRKAAVNFLYGSANKSFNAGYYEAARNRYRKVTSLDPAFAQAWNNLAGAEFRLGNFEKARQYWHRALLLKPDYVEPKVSLAYIYMQMRQFDKAKDLLERALRLAPRDNHALVNKADLYMRLGHTREAMRIARLVLTQVTAGGQSGQDSAHHLANCLIAQGKLRLGQPAEALSLLTGEAGEQTLKYRETFCRLVAGEVYLALGKPAEAVELFESVLDDAPGSVDAMIDLGRARMALGRLQEADDLLHQAGQLAPNNPWPYLIRADLQLRVADPEFAAKLLGQALRQQQDARSLAAAAQLSLKLGMKEQAAELAERSTSMEGQTPEALGVKEKLERLKR